MFLLSYLFAIMIIGGCYEEVFRKNKENAIMG